MNQGRGGRGARGGGTRVGGRGGSHGGGPRTNAFNSKPIAKMDGQGQRGRGRPSSALTFNINFSSNKPTQSGRAQNTNNVSVRPVQQAKSPGQIDQHFYYNESKKEAYNRAQKASHGNKPVEHQAHHPGQYAHFHPADKSGNIINDGTHYRYGPKINNPGKNQGTHNIGSSGRSAANSTQGKKSQANSCTIS